MESLKRKNTKKSKSAEKKSKSLRNKNNSNKITTTIFESYKDNTNNNLANNDNAILDKIQIKKRNSSSLKNKLSNSSRSSLTNNLPKVSDSLPHVSKSDKNFEISQDSILVRNFNFKPSEKVLSFDLDDTLICPKGNSAFSKNQEDWQFLFGQEKMREKIGKYITDGYCIVIFSNQGGIRKGKVDEKEWLRKIDNIQSSLNVPMLVMASLESDFYRKPSIGMWKVLCQEYIGEVVIDKNLSLYIGDAAGRSQNLKGKKDHSDSDYKFALNIGINFQVPEIFFNSSVVKASFYSKKLEFNPKELEKNESLELENIINVKNENQEMIILVGPPGSGKSTLTLSYLKNHVRVNNDILKSAIKCQKLAEDSLKGGKSVVIDNTNPSECTRRIFINIATKLGIPVRCFYFKIPKALCFHLNNLRSINEKNNISKHVPSVVIYTWYKKIEEPTLIEGFKEIIEIPFVPGPFRTKEEEEIFYMHSSAN
jgi:bifunctional polynucleotide phosphatase/kinase